MYIIICHKICFYKICCDFRLGTTDQVLRKWYAGNTCLLLHSLQCNSFSRWCDWQQDGVGRVMELEKSMGGRQLTDQTSCHAVTLNSTINRKRRRHQMRSTEHRTCSRGWPNGSDGRFLRRSTRFLPWFAGQCRRQQRRWSGTAAATAATQHNTTLIAKNLQWVCSHNIINRQCLFISADRT